MRDDLSSHLGIDVAGPRAQVKDALMSICDLDLFDAARWNTAARLLARKDRWQQPHVRTVPLTSLRTNLPDRALQPAAGQTAGAMRSIDDFLAARGIATTKAQ